MCVNLLNVQLAQYLTGGYFYGVKAAMAVYQPTLVKGNIVSESSINLSNGKGDQYSAATAGWFVSNSLQSGSYS